MPGSSALRSPSRPLYVADGGARRPLPRAPRLDALVRCAQAGDPRAFHEVAETFAPSLTRYIAGMIRDNASADDVVQETLVAAWRHMDKVNGGDHLRPWLYRVARNKALSLLRRDRTHGVGTSAINGDAHARDAAAPTDAREPASTDLECALQLAIDLLPEDAASAVRLHYVFGRTTREIAQVMGTTRSTIKMRLLRARQHIARLLPETAAAVGGCAREELNEWTDRTTQCPGGHHEAETNSHRLRSRHT